MDCVLRVEGLAVEVGGRRVLRGVSIEAGPGELHVIVGPNGAGKSTLLNAIMGLPRYRLVGGRVVVGGVDVTGKPAYERARMGIALAHQIPPALKGLTLRELAAAMRRLYGASEEAGWASRVLGIEGLMDRPLFAGMSGGERKRVELYLTVLQKPRLALLDEPDSGVDIETLERVEELLEGLKRRGVTVLLVSHTIHMLERLSERGVIDRVHVMVSGRIAASGPPGDVLGLLKERGFQGVAGGSLGGG